MGVNSKQCCSRPADTYGTEKSDNNGEDPSSLRRDGGGGRELGTQGPEEQSDSLRFSEALRFWGGSTGPERCPPSSDALIILHTTRHLQRWVYRG